MGRKKEGKVKASEEMGRRRTVAVESERENVDGKAWKKRKAAQNCGKFS